MNSDFFVPNELLFLAVKNNPRLLDLTIYENEIRNYLLDPVNSLEPWKIEIDGKTELKVEYFFAKLTLIITGTKYFHDIEKKVEFLLNPALLTAKVGEVVELLLNNFTNFE